MVEVLDLFKETRLVVAEYVAKSEGLEQQKQELKGELVALQSEMTAILLDQEGANLSERIYLKAQAKEINSRAEIINSMLEEIEDEKIALKMLFVPLLKPAQAKDGQVWAQYDANAIVDKYKYLGLQR